MLDSIHDGTQSLQWLMLLRLVPPASCVWSQVPGPQDCAEWANFFTTTMQLGGGGLESLGGDRNTYVDRIQQLKDEISSGKRDGEVSNVDPRMITENEEVMFETINLPLQEDEVTRLKEASGKRENLVDAEQEEEEDAELELALLAMFVEQGDIDASSLPKTGKV